VLERKLLERKLLAHESTVGVAAAAPRPGRHRRLQARDLREHRRQLQGELGDLRLPLLLELREECSRKSFLKRRRGRGRRVRVFSERKRGAPVRARTTRDASSVHALTWLEVDMVARGVCGFWSTGWGCGVASQEEVGFKKRSCRRRCFFVASFFLQKKDHRQLGLILV
jgi:hypothetical protein